MASEAQAQQEGGGRESSRHWKDLPLRSAYGSSLAFQIYCKLEPTHAACF
ncbi:hypothetical protein Ae717Ps2_5931 [Pseudonocardia sp. Ae717_Ps2]|nr:hypothetical protein Ae717Ps2_5886 [Pseudonocardia sp. Ae717_Ps2]OLM29007.1 hypothetical protein Ae717Ps2_5931 [Pseudonocardia sp. Ae717_Ps2]